MSLTVKNLSFFRGKEMILKGISLEIPVPGHYLLIGPSGAGKTTLLRCLAGLEAPANGLIKYDQQTWFDDDSGKLLAANRRLIGFVSQDLALWPSKSVAAHLLQVLNWRAIPKDQQQAQYEKLLALVGIEKLRHRRPHELSGGEAQRLAIARAIAGNSRLILLDEPFAQLDRGLRLDLAFQVHEIAKATGVCLIHVTHHPGEVLPFADGLFALEEGELSASGSLNDICGNVMTPFVAESLGFDFIITKPEILELCNGGEFPGVSLSTGDFAINSKELLISDTGLTMKVLVERQFGKEKDVLLESPTHRRVSLRIPAGNQTGKELKIRVRR